MSLSISSSNGAYEASRVLKSGPGLLFSLDVYSSLASAQFIQLHDSATVPANTTAGVAEVFTIAFTAMNGALLGGKYLLAEDSSGPVIIAFETETLPAPNLSAIPGSIISVKLLDADVAAVCAQKATSAIDASPEFSASLATATVTVTNSLTGARTNAADGTSGMTITTTVAGVTPVGIPRFTASIATIANLFLSYPDGLPFRNGIVVCNSTTGPTKTIGAANCYFTASTN